MHPKAQRVVSSDPKSWPLGNKEVTIKSPQERRESHERSEFKTLLAKGAPARELVAYLRHIGVIKPEVWGRLGDSLVHDEAGVAKEQESSWKPIKVILDEWNVPDAMQEEVNDFWIANRQAIKATLGWPTVVGTTAPINRPDPDFVESPDSQSLADWLRGWQIANVRELQSGRDRLTFLQEQARKALGERPKDYNPLRPVGTVLSDVRAKAMLTRLQKAVGALSPEQMKTMRVLQDQANADHEAEQRKQTVLQLTRKLEAKEASPEEITMLEQLRQTRLSAKLNTFQVKRLKRYEKIAEKHMKASKTDKKLLQFLKHKLNFEDRKRINAELRELFRTVWSGNVIVLYPLRGQDDPNSWLPAYDFIPEPTPERLLREYRPAAELQAASGTMRKVITDLEHIAEGMPDPTDPTKVVITYTSFYLACLKTAKLLHKKAHNRRLDDVIVDVAQHLVGDLYYALLAWSTGDVYDRSDQITVTDEKGEDVSYQMLVEQDDKGQRRVIQYRQGKDYRWARPESIGLKWQVLRTVAPRQFSQLWTLDRKARFPKEEEWTAEDQTRYEAFIEKATMIAWPKRNDEGEVEGLTYPARFLMMARASSYQLFGELYGKAPSLRVGGQRRQSFEYVQTNPVYANESGPFAVYEQDGFTVLNKYLQAGITIIGDEPIDDLTRSKVRAGSKSGRNLSGNDNRAEDITWYDKQGKPHKGMIPRDINPFDEVSKVEVVNRVTGAKITTTSVRKWVERPIEPDGDDPEMRPLRDRKTAIYESVDIHNRKGNLVEGIESSTLKARQGSAGKNSDGSDPVENAIRKEERMLLRILRRVMWHELTEKQQQAMLRIIRTGVHSSTTTEERLWKKLVAFGQMRMR